MCSEDGLAAICPLTCNLCPISSSVSPATNTKALIQMAPTAPQASRADCTDNDAELARQASERGFDFLQRCVDVLSFCNMDPVLAMLCPVTCGGCISPLASTPTIDVTDSVTSIARTIDGSSEGCVDQHEAVVEAAAMFGRTISSCEDIKLQCMMTPALAELCPVTCGACQHQERRYQIAVVPLLVPQNSLLLVRPAT